MQFFTDPALSVYSLVDRTSILNIFIERTPLLASWSRNIEMVVIDQQLDAKIYAGFQVLDRMQPVYARYKKLALVAKSVTVFGQADETETPLDNLHRVALNAGDALVSEWFLIVNHPLYKRALIAREIMPHTYQGVITSDPEQIARFDAALSTTGLAQTK